MGEVEVRPPGRPFVRGVLLSTACPASLASDQTKGGGRPGVQRTPRFGAREQRFDLTKIQLSSKLSPKDPKEFAKKFRDATGEPREKRLLQITNLKATLQRLHRLYIYHTEKRSGRATPEIFLLSSLASYSHRACMAPPGVVASPLLGSLDLPHSRMAPVSTF